MLDWRSLVTGALCLFGMGVAALATGTAAISAYGWGVGLLIGWMVGPVIGGAVALIIFLWLLPLHSSGPRQPTEAQVRRRVRDRSGVRSNGTISVVMPVYNGMRFLPRSLPPLSEMLKRGEILELIVVDDSSSDNSAEYAASMGATVLPSGGRLGPGAARNVAAERAKGDILWFVDADVVVYPDGASCIRRAFGEPEVVAMFGSYDDKPPEPNFGSQYKNLVHHHHHQKAGESAFTFWSGCGAVSRSAFLAVGGFDPIKYRQPSIEDVELGYRLREAGGQIRIDREFLSVHLKHWTVPELIRVDVLRRAVPWCRLMLENDEVINDLNISAAERLRAVLAAAIMIALAASLVGLAPLWLLPLLCLTAVTTNWTLFRVFYRSRGVPFGLMAMAFHQIYYIYSSCVFVFCWAEAKYAHLSKSGDQARRRNATDGSAIA